MLSPQTPTTYYERVEEGARSGRRERERKEAFSTRGQSSRVGKRSMLSFPPFFADLRLLCCCVCSGFHLLPFLCVVIVCVLVLSVGWCSYFSYLSDPFSGDFFANKVGWKRGSTLWHKSCALCGVRRTAQPRKFKDHRAAHTTTTRRTGTGRVAALIASTTV